MMADLGYIEGVALTALALAFVGTVIMYVLYRMLFGHWPR